MVGAAAHRKCCRRRCRRGRDGGTRHRHELVRGHGHRCRRSPVDIDRVRLRIAGRRRRCPAARPIRRTVAVGTRRARSAGCSDRSRRGHGTRGRAATTRHRGARITRPGQCCSRSGLGPRAAHRPRRRWRAAGNDRTHSGAVGHRRRIRCLDHLSGAAAGPWARSTACVAASGACLARHRGRHSVRALAADASPCCGMVDAVPRALSARRGRVAAGVLLCARRAGAARHRTSGHRRRRRRWFAAVCRGRQASLAGRGPCGGAHCRRCGAVCDGDTAAISPARRREHRGWRDVRAGAATRQHRDAVADTSRAAGPRVRRHRIGCSRCRSAGIPRDRAASRADRLAPDVPAPRRDLPTLRDRPVGVRILAGFDALPTPPAHQPAPLPPKR